MRTASASRVRAAYEQRASSYEKRTSSVHEQRTNNARTTSANSPANYAARPSGGTEMAKTENRGMQVQLMERITTPHHTPHQSSIVDGGSRSCVRRVAFLGFNGSGSRKWDVKHVDKCQSPAASKSSLRGFGGNRVPPRFLTRTLTAAKS